MMRQIIVKDSVNLRAPRKDGLGPDYDVDPLDSLSPGDRLDYLGESHRNSLKGRVSHIASGKFAAERIGQVGWVHTPEAELQPVQPDHPPPLDLPSVADGWKTLGIIVVVVAALGVLLYSCGVRL